MKPPPLVPVRPTAQAPTPVKAVQSQQQARVAWSLVQALWTAQCGDALRASKSEDALAVRLDPDERVPQNGQALLSAAVALDVLATASRRVALTPDILTALCSAWLKMQPSAPVLSPKSSDVDVNVVDDLIALGISAQGDLQASLAQALVKTFCDMAIAPGGGRRVNTPSAVFWAQKDISHMATVIIDHVCHALDQAERPRPTAI